MRSWQEYVREAENRLSVLKIREEILSLLESLQQRGFLTSLKTWEVENFPYIQADGGSPLAEKMLILINTDPTKIDGISVGDYVWGYMEAPDIKKEALSLFIDEEGEDKFTVARFLGNTWRLYYKVATIGGESIYISLHEGYYPPDEEE